MPRVCKRPVCYLALSPNACAVALGIRPEQIREAINNELLPVHCIGAKRKILVTDLENWVRTSWPAPKSKKRRKVPDHA
jgi:hypothetical protein